MGGFPNGDALPKPALAAAGAVENTPAPPVGLPKIFVDGLAAEAIAFPPKMFAADEVAWVPAPPKMLAA